jgi:hypothetical protein
MPLQATSGAASYDAFGGGVPVVPAYIEEVFSTYLYTGNGSTQTITNGIDLSDKGGATWLKVRDLAGEEPTLFSTDTTHGIGTNTTGFNTRLKSSFWSPTSSGFDILSGNPVENENAKKYVSWTFRKQPKFFDVVTYTGNGGTLTVSHNLGSTPGCIMVKKTSGAENWYVWHRSLNSGSNSTFINLNLTAAATNGSVFGGNSLPPTSTNFSVGPGVSVTNGSGETYVAYLFAHDAGGFGLTGTDNVISCGSFTTDGSGNATVSLGYEPQWILVKATATAGGNWEMYDNMRGLPAGTPSGSAPYSALLFANLTNAEQNGTMKINSTGFAYAGWVSEPFIYIAIRRGPMKVPTSGTSVYNADFYKGPNSPPAWISGFVTDVGIYKNRSGGGSNTFDRLRGEQQLSMDTTDAESVSNIGRFDFMNGWYNQSGAEDTTLMSWMFRRAPSFMDVVCYTGTGSNTNITHNLGVVPEMIICKQRSAVRAWAVYHVAGGNGRGYYLNDSSTGDASSLFWNSTTPNATSFRVGIASATNQASQTFVSYLFATCAGVSKVGSYTGTATTLQVDCGFTGGARFILIKRTDSTGDWYVWDSLRGIVSGNDPYLLLNGGGASPEVTNTDYIDTYSAGFEISSTAPSAINASGGTFIFLAIA